MNASQSPDTSGRVASLHLHPVEPGATLKTVLEIELVADKGIVADDRYFGKLSRGTTDPSRRQVSLIEREQIAQHAVALSLSGVAPGAVRSNIETTGIQLSSFVGKEVEIGTAVLYIHCLRDPCAKMDAICQGMRNLMMDGKQGVLAEVRRGGRICTGDTIRPRP
jgi:MOSC domain-containing protein YiiM